MADFRIRQETAGHRAGVEDLLLAAFPTLRNSASFDNSAKTATSRSRWSPSRPHAQLTTTPSRYCVRRLQPAP